MTNVDREERPKLMGCARMRPAKYAFFSCSGLGRAGLGLGFVQLDRGLGVQSRDGTTSGSVNSASQPRLASPASVRGGERGR